MAKSARAACWRSTGDKAMVQLFESSQGLKISTSKARFLGRSIELSVSMDMLGACSTAWAARATTAPR